MYIGPHTCMSGYVSAYHGVGKLCILLHTILCHAVSYVKSYEKSVKSYGKSNVDYRDDDLVNHAKKHTRIKHRYMYRLQIIENTPFDFESIEQSVLDFPDTEIH